MLLVVVALALVLAGVVTAVSAYDPHEERDLSFTLREMRAGRIARATVVWDDQRLFVTTNDGRQWYAEFGVASGRSGRPGLSDEEFMAELSEADPLGRVALTVEGNSWG
ncbi:hypothetical protein HII36_49895 [Nonomuraea sp. NN258]|uniref:hypothetical protein n=1 Tax=Nonomuraea antri TaxID=2730852 RepID=UPI0015690EC9|nr:hypothetical protein [Nonomuraea antri]NRQ39891.1 hypothetical protein [Nonomuraea antri]